MMNREVMRFTIIVKLINMGSWKKILFYGAGLWFLPFLVSFIIFPLRTSHYALFESIIVLAISASTVLFGIRYLKDVKEGVFRESAVIGIAWLLISLGIDAPLFLFGGPMLMSISQYVQQIGLKYFIIPVITSGFGYLLKINSTRK